MFEKRLINFWIFFEQKEVLKRYFETSFMEQRRVQLKFRESRKRKFQSLRAVWKKRKREKEVVMRHALEPVKDNRVYEIQARGS